MISGTIEGDPTLSVTAKQDQLSLGSDDFDYFQQTEQDTLFSLMSPHQATVQIKKFCFFQEVSEELRFF